MPAPFSRSLRYVAAFAKMQAEGAAQQPQAATSEATLFKPTVAVDDGAFKTQLEGMAAAGKTSAAAAGIKHASAKKGGVKQNGDKAARQEKTSTAAAVAKTPADGITAGVKGKK